MENDIKEIKYYIEKKDYNNLEEILGVFMISTKKLQNKNFDILCYSIQCGCSDKLIKQIYEWCNIEDVNYYYLINNKLISPLLNSFIYKNYNIIEFLIEKGANINKKYNNMTLLKYLISNEYLNEDAISILVKNQYIFSRNDFNLLFQKDFKLLIFTFDKITEFNKNIENNYNIYYDNNNNNKLREKKKIVKKLKKKAKKQ